jgi:hypothetical protein
MRFCHLSTNTVRFERAIGSSVMTCRYAGRRQGSKAAKNREILHIAAALRHYSVTFHIQFSEPWLSLTEVLTSWLRWLPASCRFWTVGTPRLHYRKWRSAIQGAPQHHLPVVQCPTRTLQRAVEGEYSGSWSWSSTHSTIGGRNWRGQAR